MAHTSVAQFAGELKLPAASLLEQLQKAGVNKSGAEDLLSETDKTKLLDYLRAAHGAAQPKPKRTARVMAFDDDGEVVHDRTFDATHFHMATGVREHHGRVWLGSLQEPAIAWFDV